MHKVQEKHIANPQNSIYVEYVVYHCKHINICVLKRNLERNYTKRYRIDFRLKKKNSEILNLVEIIKPCH